MNLIFFNHNETRKHSITNKLLFLTRTAFLMACAILLAGIRTEDASAAAKVSDHIEALIDTDETVSAIEEDGTVYASKKVTKKANAKSEKNAKTSDTKSAKNTKASDTKSEKNAKTSDTKNAKSKNDKDSKESKKDTKSAKTEKKSATKDSDTKKTSDKDTAKSTKDPKKDTKKSEKKAESKAEQPSAATEAETADDDTPHYTVHTASGAKRLADEYQDYTYEMCEKYGIAEYFDLILIQMCCESGYNPNAVGASRYYGFMQISSASFSRLESQLGLTNIREPHQNIEAGVYLMSCLIQKYGDAQAALVCYHRGESAARRGIRSDSYSSKIVAMQSTLEAA